MKETGVFKELKKEEFKILTKTKRLCTSMPEEQRTQKSAPITSVRYKISTITYKIQ